MKTRPVLLLGALMLLGEPAHAISGVLCIKATGKGAMKVRNPVCKPSEVQVGSFDTDARGVSFNGICHSDAVLVGNVCVDKYEAGVWETIDPTLIDAIRRGEATLVDLGAATQHGATGDDYGSGCPDTGNACIGFYAASVAGATPSRDLTWFQAAAACRNAGKRLATNHEWQMAALGTPDPGTDDGSTDCNVAATAAVVTTGSRSECVSDAGAYDMVGNVAEWVADWAEEPTTGCTNWWPTYGTDQSCYGGNGSQNLPGALFRGGIFNDGANAGVFAVYSGEPYDHSSAVGFRCAREP